MSLRILYLIDLPNLKGFSKEQESKEAFPILEKLRIKRCFSLILSSLSSLKKLEELTCSSSTLALLSEQDIPRELCIEIEENLTSFPIEMLAKFSKLRSLTIKDAKEIYVTREGLQSLKGLTRLFLHDCKTMRCLPEGMLGHLTGLNILEIWGCPELIELPEDIKHLHNLGKLMLWDLPKITRLPQAFQHLTLLHLHVDDLPELESLPDQLPSLTILAVRDCPKVVSIPAVPNLKALTIIGCPQLEKRCQRGSGEDWHKISYVHHISFSLFSLI